MADHWGVDSYDAANSSVSGQTLFDYVTSQAGAAPSFWGRYIGGQASLTAAEVTFILNRGCLILPIYNGATSSSVSGGYSDGVTDANNAIAAAKALNVPGGTAIYADIEASWTPTSDWIRGWCDTMEASIYAGSGGFCGDTLEPSFNTPYCDAWNADANVQDSYVYASEPEPGCTSASGAPATPPCNASGTLVWQYAEVCFTGGYVDEDVANDNGFSLMWGAQAPT